MKAQKIILINNNRYDIVSDSITLEYNSAGRAIFVIQAKENLNNQIVQLFITNELNIPEPYFSGYIEDSIQIDSHQQRIFCRELDYLLTSRMPISLRNQSLECIVKYLEQQLKLKVSLLKGIWEKKIIPNFINIGCGYDAITQIKDLASMPDIADNILNNFDKKPEFRVNSNEIGLIEIGYKVPIVLDFEPSLFYKQTIYGASCPLIPAIRPGMVLNIGTNESKTIKLVEITDKEMRICYK